MLVKSEKVSNHIRVLVRAITFAMDAMPFAGLDVDVEVEELAELVRTQARKAKVELERVDRRFVRKVLLIVNKFESGIAPEPRDLRRILDHLRIRSWNECDKEVKFLESELSKECTTSDKRDLGILSSLMAFLIYCRCTLFVDMDSVKSDFQQSDGEFSSEIISGLNWDDFKCPITLEIMTDPVTISTGQTYDRFSILKWLRSGNRTCPKTGERLMYTDLVPNLALKQLVMQLVMKMGSHFLNQMRTIIAAVSVHQRQDVYGPCFDQEFVSNGVSLLHTHQWQCGTTHSSKKASSLIRILHAFDEKNADSSMASGTHQDRVVSAW